MNTKDEHAEFVEGFLIAADTDGTGDEMIKDIEDIRLELVLTRTSKIIYN